MAIVLQILRHSQSSSLRAKCPSRQPFGLALLAKADPMGIIDNKQTPLHSGIDATTTATEALAGRDLSGVQAIVTGGASGLGLETVRVLAGAGARVLVPARDPHP